MSEQNISEVLDQIMTILKKHEEKIDDLFDKMDDLNKTEQQVSSSPSNVRAGKKKGPQKDTVPGHKSVLVVDDNKNLVRSFKLVLEDFGFAVDSAHTGLDTLYKTRSKHYDLIILDMNLPDMMGNEIAKRVKKENDGVKIIMMTGYSSYFEDIGSTPEIDDYIIKPIPPEALVEMTKKVLGSK
ncbi:MAG: response regulator [Candidatus Bathyarchaeota archaeon]|nr:response regulator [Candidatus Bathyarchaeota archaeon]